jgi:hypothetical protein
MCIGRKYTVKNKFSTIMVLAMGLRGRRLIQELGSREG